MPAVVTGVANVLAHAPGLVRYGSKPSRDLRASPALEPDVLKHLRSFDDAVRYPPNQVYLGGLAPAALGALPRPWYGPQPAASARGPFGVMIDERALVDLLADCDRARLVTLGDAAAVRPLVAAGALPLQIGGETVGCVSAGHEEDDALAAAVILENLACKATGVLALRELLAQVADRVGPDDVDFVVSGSEEAVGDRYQRGGGNIAKAIGEAAGLRRASGHDVKAFCASTLYAVLTAAAYIEAGLFRRVVVVAGGSLAKLGMKYRAHVAKGMPILEDVLAGIAVLLEAGASGDGPVVRTDTASFHRIGDGSSQQAILESLVLGPLDKAGCGFTDVDCYVTEMHNPEVTVPAGSGDVPAGNYRLIAALAAMKGAIPRAAMGAFVAEHGLTGYAPTQGHIASAVCHLAHVRQGMATGTLHRALLMAKGSLFLGRLTELSDGVSLLLEA